jgi:hypothetical protein
MKTISPTHLALLNAAVVVKDRLKTMALRATDAEMQRDLYACVAWLSNGMKARSVVRPRRDNRAAALVRGVQR